MSYNLIMKHCDPCDVAWQVGWECWACGSAHFRTSTITLTTSQVVRYSDPDLFGRFDTVLRSSPA